MPRRYIIAAVVIVPAVLYLATLYPGVGGRGNTGDSAKFQYIGEVLGVPHQPGYPQYVMLNFLWTRLPLPMELATRVNLLSAVFALAAGAFLFLFFRELSGRTGPALLATWTVLLARTVWSYSTEAEVYSLHLLWIAAVSWAATVWTRRQEKRWLLALLALYAFSFGNHPTMITLLPGLAIVLFSLAGRKLFEKRLVLTTVVLIAASLAQYGYVLWRSHSDAPFVEGIGREADLSRLADSMSGDRFTSKNLFRQGESELIGRLSGVPTETLLQLGPVAVLLGVWGLFVAFRRAEPMRWYLLLGILGPSAFIAAYHIGDWQAYLTPAWVMLAGLAAVGLGRGAKRSAWPLMIVWLALGAFLATLSFRALYVEENENDRGLLVAAAGQDAQLVTYRGPGYKSKQLNNYYRFGLHLEEDRNLRFLTARQAFDEEYAYLEERPLYFMDKRVKRFFDKHQVDYVQRWQNENPLSNYFVTGARWPLDRLTVDRDPSGRLVVRSSETHTLTLEPDPIQVVVVDGTTRRTRGVAMFSFGDGWQDDPKRLNLLGFLDKIAEGDWFCLVAQGSQVRVNPATLAAMGERLGFPADALAWPASEAVLAGRKGLPQSLTAASEPEEKIVLELRSKP